MYCSHGTVFALPARCARVFKPKLMGLSYVSCHNRRRNNVVLETCVCVWFRNPTKDPEECFCEVFLSLHANTARSISRNERFYLYMNKPCSCDVTAQDISVRCVTKRGNRRIAAATKLAGNEELTCVTPATFFFFGHESLRAQTLNIRALRQNIAETYSILTVMLLIFK